MTRLTDAQDSRTYSMRAPARSGGFPCELSSSASRRGSAPRSFSMTVTLTIGPTQQARARRSKRRRQVHAAETSGPSRTADAGSIAWDPATLAVGYLPQERAARPRETLLAYLARAPVSATPSGSSRSGRRRWRGMTMGARDMPRAGALPPPRRRRLRATCPCGLCRPWPAGRARPTSCRALGRRAARASASTSVVVSQPRDGDARGLEEASRQRTVDGEASHVGRRTVSSSKNRSTRVATARRPASLSPAQRTRARPRRSSSEGAKHDRLDDRQRVLDRGMEKHVGHAARITLFHERQLERRSGSVRPLDLAMESGDSSAIG